MSAWIASDRHIASVAKYYAEHRGVSIQRVANLLKRENIQSVNYRYGDETPVTPCDIHDAMDLELADVYSLASSLDYQSCETPTYKSRRASEVLELIKHMVHDEASVRFIPLCDRSGSPLGQWSI